MQNIDLEKLQTLRWLFSVYTNQCSSGVPGQNWRTFKMFTFLEFGVKMFSFDFHLENKKNPN